MRSILLTLALAATASASYAAADAAAYVAAAAVAAATTTMSSPYTPTPAPAPAPKIVNLTPHAVALNDGTVFPPDGTVARVAVTYVRFLQPLRGTSIPLYARGLGQTALLGLPPPAEHTYYIVSAALAEAAKPLHRPDLIVP
jgi:hypothetical protein